MKLHVDLLNNGYSIFLFIRFDGWNPSFGEHLLYLVLCHGLGGLGHVGSLWLLCYAVSVCTLRVKIPSCQRSGSVSGVHPSAICITLCLSVSFGLGNTKGNGQVASPASGFWSLGSWNVRFHNLNCRDVVPMQSTHWGLQCSPKHLRSSYVMLRKMYEQFRVLKEEKLSMNERKVQIWSLTSERRVTG